MVGYVRSGRSHLFVSPPRAGKTELLTALCIEWLSEGKRILYVTEEPRDIWYERFDAHPELRIGSFSIAWGLEVESEQELYAGVFSTADAIEFDILVLDTIRHLLHLKDESDNAEIANKCDPWIHGCQKRQITPIFVHHANKAGGSRGRGISGGYAFLSAFDTVFEIEYVGREDDESKRRERLVRTRKRGAPVPDFVYELQDDGSFERMNEGRAFGAVVRRVAAIWDDDKSSRLSIRAIRSLLGKPEPSDQQIQKVLAKLISDGVLSRDPPAGTSAAGLKNVVYFLAG